MTLACGAASRCLCTRHLRSLILPTLCHFNARINRAPFNHHYIQIFAFSWVPSQGLAVSRVTGSGWAYSSQTPLSGR